MKNATMTNFNEIELNDLLAKSIDFELNETAKLYCKVKDEMIAKGYLTTDPKDNLKGFFLGVTKQGLVEVCHQTEDGTVYGIIFCRLDIEEGIPQEEWMLDGFEETWLDEEDIEDEDIEDEDEGFNYSVVVAKGKHDDFVNFIYNAMAKGLHYSSAAAEYFEVFESECLLETNSLDKAKQLYNTIINDGSKNEYAVVALIENECEAAKDYCLVAL